MKRKYDKRKGKSEQGNGGNVEMSKRVRMSMDRCCEECVPKEKYQDLDAE